MKQIPKSIENKIRNCAKHYAIANKENEEIREWLFKNKYGRALNDMLIDSCQLSNMPEGFIDFLNGEEDNLGNHISDFMNNEIIGDFNDYN